MVTGEEYFFDEEKHFQKLLDHAKSLIGRKLTREQTLQELINAGIKDKYGNYAEPYKALQKFTPTAPK